MTMRRLVALGPALSLVACAAEPPRGPFFGDERYLVVGVRPDREADELQAALENTGRVVRVRFSGQHFTALGFGDAHREALGVRVITPRGIALALDADEGDPLHPARRYRLVQAPLVEGHDADGDGFEEVFVERITGPEPERCLVAYRVRDSGFVDPVVGAINLAGPARRDEPVWLEPYFCQ